VCRAGIAAINASGQTAFRRLLEAFVTETLVRCCAQDRGRTVTGASAPSACNVAFSVAHTTFVSIVSTPSFDMQNTGSEAAITAAANAAAAFSGVAAGSGATAAAAPADGAGASAYVSGRAALERLFHAAVRHQVEVRVG
jgi:hypothetical protein